jgi:hypothetical protein
MTVASVILTIAEVRASVERSGTGGREEIGLGGLPPGLYFYQFETSGGLRQVGKLVVGQQ